MSDSILVLTAQIVAAHLSKNATSADDVSGLIQTVYQSLSSAGTVSEPEVPARSPAVPIKKSVFPEYIVCLEDGKKLKMLKRHLQTSYGLTPAEYRAKWGLPADYPMVAPAYAAKRSSLAKHIGLGRKPAAVQTEEPTDAEEPMASDEPSVTKVRARKARGSKG